MSDVERVVAQLEQHKIEQKTLVSARDAALRLAQNKDFRELILDGFCLHEAARYAQESGDPLLTPAQRQDALNMAQASGHLKRFLSLCIQQGNTAERNIQDADNEIDRVREEGID